jgi:hypothetical protein
LFLAGGKWEGDRVVSREWVEESTRTQIKFRGPGAGYGYKWQQMSLRSGDNKGELLLFPGWWSNISSS